MLTLHKLSAAIVLSNQREPEPQSHSEEPHCIVTEKALFAAADELLEWAVSRKEG